MELQNKIVANQALVAEQDFTDFLETLDSSPLGAGGGGEKIAYVLSLHLENASLVSPASVTIEIQKRNDNSAYETIDTHVLGLRGAVGLQSEDRAFPTFFGILAYTGADYGTVRMKVRMKTTGSHVIIKRAELLLHGPAVLIE